MCVMQCDRAGCENIMCGRLSYDFGYICDDCFKELETQTNQSIERFMKSPKVHDEIKQAWCGYVDEIFSTTD